MLTRYRPINMTSSKRPVIAIFYWLAILDQFSMCNYVYVTWLCDKLFVTEKKVFVCLCRAGKYRKVYVQHMGLFVRVDKTSLNC